LAEFASDTFKHTAEIWLLDGCGLSVRTPSVVADVEAVIDVDVDNDFDDDDVIGDVDADLEAAT
jgi:hypothetical protein